MAFHPYPQVIAAVFNRRAFGPPRGLTPASACPRIAHPASRPRRGTQVALLRLAFAPAPFRLTSPRASDSLAHSTKGTPSHHKGAPTARGRTVSGTVSLFCSKCFSPFPHGTGSLSVSREYLALPDGPGRFAQDSSCPALLRIPLCCISLHILDYHRLWSHFPKCSVHDLHTMSRSYNPAGALRRQRFGLFPVRSPLLGESFIYFLFLQVLRCFSSLR